MKIAADGTQQYVYNIKPTFFDLSYVGVPADRTGYGFRADYLPHEFSKSASFDDERTSESLLGIRSFTGWTLQYCHEMRDMLGKLAAYEKSCLASGPDRALSFGLRAIPQDSQLGEKLAAMLPETRTVSLGLLAREGILLSPENFSIAFSLGKTASVDLRIASGSIYADTLDRYKNCRPDIPASVLAALDDTAHRKLAEMRLPVQTLRSNRLTPAMIVAAVPAGTIRYVNSFQKNAAGGGAMFRDLAESYVLANAASLCRFPLEMQGFGVKLAVWYTMGHGPF